MLLHFYAKYSVVPNKNLNGNVTKYNSFPYFHILKPQKVQMYILNK